MNEPVVWVSSEKLEYAQKELASHPGKLDRAIKEALYRAGDGLKTDAVKETTDKYHLKASDIRKHLLYKKAGGPMRYHSVILTAQGSRRDISEYKVTGSGKNLRVAVRKTGSKKLRTGFLSSQIKDKNNKTIVLWRPQGEGVGPVKKVKTLSIPQAIRNKETMATMEKQVHERFEKRLDQNIDRMIRGSWRG